MPRNVGGVADRCEKAHRSPAVYARPRHLKKWGPGRPCRARECRALEPDAGPHGQSSVAGPPVRVATRAIVETAVSAIMS